jgi:hypothetical protein
LAPTVEIAATGFCHPGGILQLFHRQDQQILRLPTAAAAKSLQQIQAGSLIVIVRKIFIDLLDYAGAIDSSALHESAESFGAFEHRQIASKKRKSNSRRDQIVVLA